MRRPGGGWGRARKLGIAWGGILDGFKVGICWYGGVAGADAAVGLGLGVFRLWFRGWQMRAQL